MNTMFYTGKSGLIAYQTGLDTIGQNIANTSTTGYKAQYVDFRELLYNEMDINKNDALNENEKINTGHGVRAYDDSLNLTNGTLSNTGLELDFALETDGFFAVQQGDTISYTRDGAFDISVEQDGNYLVAADGAYVLDSAGQRIAVPDGANGLPDFDGIAERIGVYDFENPYALLKTDGQRFLETGLSGQAQALQPDAYALKQFYLERSNVDISKEISDMIVTQRAFQFSSKVVQTADEIEDIVNSLRR